jgi:hypothetical protein
MIFISFNQKQHLFSSNISEHPTNPCASLVEIFVLIFYTPLELQIKPLYSNAEKSNSAKSSLRLITCGANE